jgi:putative transposase
MQPHPPPRGLRDQLININHNLAPKPGGPTIGDLPYGPARTGPWKAVEDVELATLGWVYWHNTSRLHSYLADVPPTEFEAAFYDAQRTDQPLIGIP